MQYTQSQDVTKKNFNIFKWHTKKKIKEKPNLLPFSADSKLGNEPSTVINHALCFIFPICPCKLLTKITYLHLCIIVTIQKWQTNEPQGDLRKRTSNINSNSAISLVIRD